MSIQWAAGLFEGEGCLYRDKRCSTWTLQLRMTDEDIVQRFAKVVGCGNPIAYESNERARLDKGPRKPVWRWTCSKRSDVRRIAELFIPYLGLRRTYTFQNCLDDYDEHELKRKTNTSTRSND